jgi:hypothetical protein
MVDPITERATYHYTGKVHPSGQLYIACGPIDRLPHPGQGLAPSEAFRLTPRAAWSNDTIATPADQERASELRPRWASGARRFARLRPHRDVRADAHPLSAEGNR